MKIGHFAFEVSNLDESIRFYRENLGFELKTTLTDPDEHESLAILALEGGELELIQVLDESNRPKLFEPIPLRPHFLPHLAFQTKDLARDLVLITSRGLKPVHGPLEIPGAAKWLYLCDPDGNVIEIYQDLSQDS